MAKGKDAALLETGVLDSEDDITRNLSYEAILHGQGVRRRGGRLVREALQPRGRSQDGLSIVYHKIERPVALTIEQARSEGSDYYDPNRETWVRGGLKPEREAPENLGSNAGHEVVLVPIGNEPTEDEIHGI